MFTLNNQLDDEDIDVLCSLIKLLDHWDREAEITDKKCKKISRPNLLNKEQNNDKPNCSRTQGRN